MEKYTGMRMMNFCNRSLRLEAMDVARLSMA